MKNILSWVSVGMFLFFQNAHAQNAGARFNTNKYLYLNGVLSSSNPVSSVAPAWNSDRLPKWYSLDVTATAASFNVLLEGSLDQQSWVTIATAISSGVIVSNINPVPVLYLRMRETSISGNEMVTATAIGTW